MSRITRHRDAPYWVHSAPTIDPEDLPNDKKPPTQLPTAAELHDLAKNACHGRCNQAWRTRDWAAEAIVELEAAATEGRAVDRRTVLRGVPKPAEPVWCRECAGRIRIATTELVQLWADVEPRDDGQLAAGGHTERLGTRVAPPSPSPAWDYWQDVATWAITWAEAVSDWLANRDRAYLIEFGEPEDGHLGWKVYLDGPTATPASVPPALTSAVGYLTGHMSAVLSAPFAREYGDEVTGLVRRCRLAFGIDELVHHLPLPCLQCDKKLLRRKDGQDRIRCIGCGASWTQESYERLSVAFRHVQERRKA